MRFKNFKSKFLAFVVSGANFICAQNNAGAIRDIADFMKVQKTILKEGRSEFAFLLAMLSELCYHAELKNISQDQLIEQIEEINQENGNTALSFAVPESVASSGDAEMMNFMKRLGKELGKELGSNVIAGPTFELCKAILQKDNCDEIANLLIALNPGQLAVVGFVTDIILGRLLEIYRPGYVRNNILPLPQQDQDVVQAKLKILLQINHLQHCAAKLNKSMDNLLEESLTAVLNFNQYKESSCLTNVLSTRSEEFLTCIAREALSARETIFALVRNLTQTEGLENQMAMLSASDFMTIIRIAGILQMLISGTSLVKPQSVV